MTLLRHPYSGLFWTDEYIERYAALEDDGMTVEHAIQYLVKHRGFEVVRAEDIEDDHPIAKGDWVVELDGENYARMVASEEVKATVDEIKSFIVSQRTVKDSYSVAEIAIAVNRSPYQVRKWCREGRIEAHKLEGVGPDGKEHWAIPHSALEYYRNRKLLPRKG